MHISLLGPYINRAPPCKCLCGLVTILVEARGGWGHAERAIPKRYLGPDVQHSPFKGISRLPVDLIKVRIQSVFSEDALKTRSAKSALNQILTRWRAMKKRDPPEGAPLRHWQAAVPRYISKVSMGNSAGRTPLTIAPPEATAQAEQWHWLEGTLQLQSAFRVSSECLQSNLTWVRCEGCL